MLDIHSHIIYGIDDGAKTFEDTKKMIAQALSNNISHIIATPHYNDFVSKDFFDIRDQHLSEIKEYITAKNIELIVEAGCEISFQIDWDNFTAFDRCLIKDKYLLLEFSDLEMPDNFMEIIFSIRKKGYIPIIAHPERSYKIQEDFNIVRELHRMGCLFQLDAGSLKNHFGKEARKTALKFINMNLYHFIGSDAHGTRGRTYNVFENLDIKSYQNEKLRNNNDIVEQELVLVSNDNFVQRFLKKMRTR